ncbi:uncharacterized protein PAC_14035 [Phialocephala subalpina]|uniref:Uncharacterized protein n=1 Tax=Phialocephala subalpina TaxID=576137 RepID=A0A1L7XGK1_9HELO|nr:uncharacterized protein PAC_14035 [Phialocephala subalpina]
MALQTISDVYIDSEKLKALLAKLFRPGQYRVQFKANQWTLQLPRSLTQGEIESVEQPGQY